MRRINMESLASVFLGPASGYCETLHPIQESEWENLRYVTGV